jgi:hypothetical protein
MSEVPRRRWSFSLKTLFVLVLAIALLLGWCIRVEQWRHERAKFLLSITTNAPPGRRVDTNAGGLGSPWQLRIWSPFPRTNELMLNWSVVRIYFSNDDPPELMNKARSLFPEAEIRHGQ